MQTHWQRKAKDLFWQTLYFCGGFDLLHSLNGAAKILMYHRFDEEPSFRKISMQTFESQLHMLTRRFSIISLSEYTEILQRGETPGPETIVLTFDDGYQDFYYYAFPVLQKLGIPATLFVTTDFVDGRLWMWPDTLEYALLQCRKKLIHLPLNGINYRFILDSYLSRMKAWNAIADYCLTVNNEEKHRILDMVAQVCGVRVPGSPSPEYQALSWDQLRYMAHHDIEIGSHTVTHPILSKVEKTEQLLYEIHQSKQRISDMLQMEVKSFAYPNGNSEDYTIVTKQAVKKAGYECAVVSYPLVPDFDTDFLYELGRRAISEDIVYFRKKIFDVERPFIRYHTSSGSPKKNDCGAQGQAVPAHRRLNSFDKNLFSLHFTYPKNKKSSQRKS